MMVSRGLFGWSPPHIQPLTPVSEVSEPPESPSPYMDTGGGEAMPVEVEDEMEEQDEMEPPPAAVPFSRLFACADRLGLGFDAGWIPGCSCAWYCAGGVLALLRKDYSCLEFWSWC
ncbi:unnamed protein product [Rhodiola kirilowii]